MLCLLICLFQPLQRLGDIALRVDLERDPSGAWSTCAQAAFIVDARQFDEYRPLSFCGPCSWHRRKDLLATIECDQTEHRFGVDLRPLHNLCFQQRTPTLHFRVYLPQLRHYPPYTIAARELRQRSTATAITISAPMMIS